MGLKVLKGFEVAWWKEILVAFGLSNGVECVTLAIVVFDKFCYVWVEVKLSEFVYAE